MECKSSKKMKRRYKICKKLRRRWMPLLIATMMTISSIGQASRIQEVLVQARSQRDIETEEGEFEAIVDSRFNPWGTYPYTTWDSLFVLSRGRDSIQLVLKASTLAKDLIHRRDPYLVLVCVDLVFSNARITSVYPSFQAYITNLLSYYTSGELDTDHLITNYSSRGKGGVSAIPYFFDGDLVIDYWDTPFGFGVPPQPELNNSDPQFLDQLYQQYIGIYLQKLPTANEIVDMDFLQVGHITRPLYWMDLVYLLSDHEARLILFGMSKPTHDMVYLNLTFTGHPATVTPYFRSVTFLDANFSKEILPINKILIEQSTCAFGNGSIIPLTRVVAGSSLPVQEPAVIQEPAIQPIAEAEEVVVLQAEQLASLSVVSVSAAIFSLVLTAIKHPRHSLIRLKASIGRKKSHKTRNFIKKAIKKNREIKTRQ